MGRRRTGRKRYQRLVKRERHSFMIRTWLAVTAVAVTLGQTLVIAHAPAFEVASIRANPGPMWRVLQGYSASGRRLTLEAWRPFALIMEAYDLKMYQVSFTPSDDALYD